MRTAVVFALAALCSAGAAPVPKQPAKAPDGLEGKWKIDAMRRGEKAFPLPPGSMTVEFREGFFASTFVMVTGVGTKDEVSSTAVLTHDPTLRRVRTTEHRNAKGQVVNPDVTYGYQIDGDKLILATRQGANLAFGPASPLDPGDTDVVMLFTRVKK